MYYAAADMSKITLPSLHQVYRALREVNAAWNHPDGGPEFASLVLVDKEWRILTTWEAKQCGWPHFGSEWLPADTGKVRCNGSGSSPAGCCS